MKFPHFSAAVCVTLAMAAPLAQADSGAQAFLSFNVLSASGFSWLASPVSTADTSASATPMNGFTLSAGVFSPNYGQSATNDKLATGTAVPASTAGASAADVFANAVSFGSPLTATLAANVLVPTSGRAEATTFARSWFSLTPGASVTFQGALMLSMTGRNLAWPANHSTGDFYGFASGLLAVGSQEAARQLGGPASTGLVGNYSLNDFGALSLSVTNTTGSLFTSYLDSGVTVYSASAVPEPGAYALLLAGLGVVAFVAGRRSTGR